MNATWYREDEAYVGKTAAKGRCPGGEMSGALLGKTIGELVVATQRDEWVIYSECQ